MLATAERLRREAAEATARQNARQQMLRGADIDAMRGEWRTLPWMMQSVVNEGNRGVNLTPLIRRLLGPERASDLIGPMLLQQSLTLKLVHDAALMGLFSDPEALMKLMLRFVDPLLDITENRPPPHWQRGFAHPLISYAQPSFNTVALGTTHHIMWDFPRAFKDHSAEKGAIVLPEDWQAGWSPVVAALAKTGPAIFRQHGHTSWTVGGSALDTRLGALVRATRDTPYINYARAEGVDLRDHMSPYGFNYLLKPPSDETTAIFHRLAQKDFSITEYEALTKAHELEIRRKARNL